ncbi:MAG TPA: diaminopimelate decarboxylase [bacterium]|nr:diaminopimelate decarboxylase [bacterium]HPQ66623.1 diaminopimelate decarboxylase [bacterium]
MNLPVNSDYWSYRGGELYCEDVALSRIAERFGTPTYVYSRGHLEGKFKEVERAWRGRRHLVCFSLKSNSSLAVAAVLARLGAGVDVVSGGELYRALKAGFPAAKTVFAGVGKTSREIREALKAGILFFTVESFSELEEIDGIAGKMGAQAPVAFRVTPDVDPKTHRYITTGKAENKFGFDLEHAREVYLSCRRLGAVKPVGIQMHIGSQIRSAGPYVEAVEKLAALVRGLKREGVGIRYLDIGGGMGISYGGEEVPAMVEYAEALRPVLAGLPVSIVLEPGRYLTGNCGCLLAKVLHLKRKAKKNFAVIDAGMNDLIRPALYNAEHAIVPVSEKTAPAVKVDVVGPICETGDTMGKDRMFPEPAPGDLVAVLSAGAYGFVMASTYNSRPRPAEVMVHGGECELVRRRETYRDLVKGEKIPSFSEKE